MIKVKIIFFFLILSANLITAQQIGRGSATSHEVGIHDGNRVITVFNNWGVIAQPGNNGPAGAWKYPSNKYVGDVSPLIGVRLPYRDYNSDSKEDTVYSVIITDVDRPGGGDYSPGGGDPWTFQPIPGFASSANLGRSKGVAMSHLPETWPPFWPDQPTWKDENGNAEWNGYFGRGQMNADQESYYMMDDNNDKKMFLNYGFLPDSTDPTRKGQGLRMAVRGLQWSDFLAQDVIFWLYQISNIGTTVYNQVVFGALVGTYVGLPGDEWNDDASYFNIRDNITYTWDFDNYIRPSANPDWKPTPYDVGYVAYAFLESPGNKYDGIDNDGDSKDNAPYFNDKDFEPKILRAGQKLILIDKSTYQRTEFLMPNYPVNVVSLGKEFTLVPDSTVLVEGNIDKNGVLNRNAYDGCDNDFDGIIDENYQIHYRQYKKDFKSNAVLIDTLNPVKYKNYLENVDRKYKMIDEARDDGIDNDDDWSKDPSTGTFLFDENFHLFDDVGADGKRNTSDQGENDGFPTHGGPNFDETDVDESDQIGLTSFQYFVPAGDITMSDENDMWRRLRPGYFDVATSVRNNIASKGEDGDFIYGSGYFPILPNNTERFSIAFCFGDDYESTIKTKRIAQMIYNANYNFPKPPSKPTLTAVPGDHKVTLYWNKIAETTSNTFTKNIDFEGYMIYKSTDPTFSDIMKISDKDGNPQGLKPLAQFDLIDGVKGLFVPSQQLNELRNGVPFYLGDDTGIKNTFIDTDVKNGVTYFYAVVAYNKGDTEKNLFPAVNSHYISVDISGNFSPDINCAVVVPNAPVAGYQPPETRQMLTRLSGNSTTIPYYEVLDPAKVLDAEYEVSFIDSLINGTPIAYAYRVKNISSGKEIFLKNLHFKADNNDVFDGVMLRFDVRFQHPDSIKVNSDVTHWNIPSEKNLQFNIQIFDFPNYPKGIVELADYALVFSDLYNKESTANLMKMPLPAKKVNFELLNITNHDSVFHVPFAFISNDTILSGGDRIIMATTDQNYFTWSINFIGKDTRIPASGDTLYISIIRPFTVQDKFVFETHSSTIDKKSVADQIDRIKVVPNPYIVSNIFEHPLPSQIKGRGERIVKFIHLPANSKISIYTSAGNFVRTIYHDGNYEDGSASWDLRTEEGLDVAFGVYFYIVEIPETGQKKFGKIALIK